MTGLTRTPLMVLALAGGIAPLTAVSYVPTATVLTLEGATVAPGQPTTSWNEIMTGPICQQATTCTAVDYPSYASGLGVLLGAGVLNQALAQTDGDVVVFGYSNGAMVGSVWLAANALLPTAQDADRVSFVLVGNVFRKHGGALGFLTALLPDTQYQVTDVTRQYDWLSDFPTNPLNLVALANAAAGFATVHVNYHDVDLTNPEDNPEYVVWTEGNATYVFVPTENLPLLEPLRAAGFNDLADQLNGPLKIIVEDGYNRDLPETDGDPTGVAGHSTNNIITNLVNGALQAPANELVALQELATALGDSQSTDAAKLTAVVNALVPLPAIAEPVAEELNSIAETGEVDVLTPTLSVFENLTAPPESSVGNRQAEDADADEVEIDEVETGEVEGAETVDAADSEDADSEEDRDARPGRHRTGEPVRRLLDRLAGSDRVTPGSSRENDVDADDGEASDTDSSSNDNSSSDDNSNSNDNNTSANDD